MPSVESYAEQHPHLFADWDYPAVLADLLRSSSGTVLELGSGDGSKLHSLQKAGLLDHFDEVIATDLSSLRIATLSSRLPGVRALVADAMALPFDDGSIDVVLSDQVIEHVEDDSAMASEIWRVLRPGGRAYIASVMRLPGGWYFYRNNGGWRIDPTHMREYESSDAFRHLFESAGFSVAALETWPISFALTDFLIHFARRVGLVSRRDAVDLYTTSSTLASLRRFGLAIPRYKTIGVVVQKATAA